MKSVKTGIQAFQVFSLPGNRMKTVRINSSARLYGIMTIHSAMPKASARNLRIWTLTITKIIPVGGVNTSLVIIAAI